MFPVQPKRDVMRAHGVLSKRCPTSARRIYEHRINGQSKQRLTSPIHRDTNTQQTRKFNPNKYISKRPLLSVRVLRLFMCIWSHETFHVARNTPFGCHQGGRCFVQLVRHYGLVHLCPATGTFPILQFNQYLQINKSLSTYMIFQSNFSQPLGKWFKFGLQFF